MQARTRQWIIYIVIFAGAAVLTAGVAALLVNINQRQLEAREFPLKVVEIPAGEIDPAVWGQNFPRQYDRFKPVSYTHLTLPTIYSV